ncbi:MAG: amylo-alpha-1,6-glucosidase [Vicinamibacterales bacterium]
MSRDAHPPELVRRLAWPSGDPDPYSHASPEWLVTNGLGGYASGTVSGAITRRFHGLLVAAHPAPLGRVMMLNYLSERVRGPSGSPLWLSAYGDRGTLAQQTGSPYLAEFRLEGGLPVWQYRLPHAIVERSVLMPAGRNTVHVTYRVLDSEGPLRLVLRPLLGFRRHEAPLDASVGQQYDILARDRRIEIRSDTTLPVLRLAVDAARAAFTVDDSAVSDVRYLLEERRGYDHTGALWSPGYFRVELREDAPVTLIGSTEPWEHVAEVSPDGARAAERTRRSALISAADAHARSAAPAELVVAADQFVIRPATRLAEPELPPAGEDQRTVIAGYHWFTDWGRDTMIALEGLTLVTGRHAEARQILETFARHTRDGLIPNLFPEGEREGLYHTADATLWFFHALERYDAWTGDHDLVARLLPVLEDIVAHHQAGTRFGIHVDADGLLTQGADGYQLTWMDAKVDGWVVTPRRGKAVEINALWHNALEALAHWLTRAGRTSEADAARVSAARTRTAFNQRFWNPATGHLFDVVDGEQGDDPACRPNQVLAISLPHPVLDRARWDAVLEVVRRDLLTPRGLRSLAPSDPAYQPRYDGDLRARDAAYHQGTVWSWLMGPFVDAWLACRPGDVDGLRAHVEPMLAHLARPASDR